MTKSLREHAEQVKGEGDVRCNCDFDKWEPESSGHTQECRIHIVAGYRMVREIDKEFNK